MPVETRPFTFLQVSDVHLDSTCGSKTLGLPLVKRHQRKGEILSAFERAIQIAKESRVDAVLIPGDLWDMETISSQTINRVIECLLEIPEIFVVIAPGNHDYFSKDSPYNQHILKAKGMRPWPDNVHIFQSPQFETVRHPKRPDVSFTGRAFLSNVPTGERLLASPVPRDESAPINVLLFHGSLDSYRGKDSGLPGKHTAPFSQAELKALSFSYTGLGHFHHFTEIKDETTGKLLAAYTGCLVGRTMDEAGPRYALLGEIQQSTKAQGSCKLRPMEIDLRRIVTCEVDISGLTFQQVLDQVSTQTTRQGARPQQDIVFVRLTGHYVTGGEPSYVEARFRDYFWHFALEDKTRPDYLNETFDARTTEGKFVETLLALRKKAIAQGGILLDTEYGALSAGAIEDAIYYGLDALRHGKVVIRHVD